MPHTTDLRRFAWVAIVALPLLTGCGDDNTTTTTGSSTTSSSSTTGGGDAGVAPFVTDAVPAEGETGVSIALSSIQVTFSEEMDTAVGDGILNGVMLTAPTWDGNTATFPVTGLAYGTPYKLVLQDFADVDGMPLDGMPYLDDGALDFTTEADPGDMDPPEVITTIPAEGELDVAVDTTTIEVTFDEAMDTSAVDAALVGGAAPVPLTGSWSPDGTVLTFPLASLLDYGTAYTVDLSGFTDVAGNPVDPLPYIDDGFLDFTTAAFVDTTAPFAIASSPAEGASVPPTTTTIAIDFNEAMDPSVSAASLDDGTATVPLTGTWSAGDTHLEFTLPGILPWNAVISLDLTGMRDVAGNPLDAAHPYLGDGVLDFMTDPDTDPPAVVLASPVEGQMDTPVALGTIEVTFDEAMDTSTASAALVGGASPVPLSGSWSPDGTTLTFPVSIQLDYSTAYSVDLSGFADAAGNPLDPLPYVGDGILDFTTAAFVDMFAPYVYASSPAEGATTVAPSLAEIVVDFVEAMDTSINTASLDDGTTTLPLTGTWSVGNTRLTLPLPDALTVGTAFTLDLTGMQDPAGNPLDASHPYLGDGILDFETIVPTGESCADPLVLSQSGMVGNAHVWTIPAGSVTSTNGQFACDPNTQGPDAVIHYKKTSPDLAGGGSLLHVNAISSSTSTSNYLNLEITSGACNGTVEKCLWYKQNWDSYLDVPAGDYYIWVEKNSTGTFPGATITIDEVAAADAEGEGCWAPYTTSSAIYTPPAMAGDPHTWTIPPSINSFDMGVTWGEPGSISCDDHPTYGDIHGVDAVIAFDKTSSTSVLQLGVQNLAPVITSSDLDVEILTVCDPNDPNKISLQCGANADVFSFTTLGPASTLYVWVSTEATNEEFQGASVQLTELFPGVGEHWTNAEPILASGPITPTSTLRLDPPSCFPAMGNVHWYAYTLTNDVLSLLADVPGEIGLLDSTGQEVACTTDASTLAIGHLASPGSTIYIAVGSPTPIGALTINDLVYTGVRGPESDFGVTWPASSTVDYGMAVSGTELFIGGTTSLFAIPKAGGSLAVQHGSADGITSTQLGYSLQFAAGSLFSVDTTGTTTSSRLFKIHDEASGIWGPTTWDTPPPYPTGTYFYAMSYDGTNLILAARSTAAKVDLYSISPTAPGTPVLLGTNTGVDYVVGVAADSQYFYVSGRGRPSLVYGIYRISRAAPTSTPELIATSTLSTTRTNMAVDDYTTAQNLYFRSYNPSDIHVIVAPGQPSAVHLGPISTLGNTADYAMTFDIADKILYFYETETLSTGRIQLLK